MRHCVFLMCGCVFISANIRNRFRLSMRNFSHKKRGFRMICASFCLFAAHRQNIGCLILHRACAESDHFRNATKMIRRPATLDFPRKTNFFDFSCRIY